MHFNDSRELCNRYMGKVVRIHDKSGREHVGRITKVTNEKVWIEPVENQRSSRNLNSSNNRNNSKYTNRNNNYSNRRGSSYNSYGYGDVWRNERRFERRDERRFDRRFEREDCRCGFFGCSCGAAIAISLGFIAGIALAALFFFW
jgi:hypothetical protein